MAARPQTSAFAPILLSIKQRLLDEVLGDDGYVVIGRKTPDSAYIAERYCKLVPSGPRTLPNTAAGKHYKPFRRFVTVELSTRLSLDTAGQGESAFTDSSGGHLYHEESVVAALDLWTPRNSAGTANLTYQPIRLAAENPDYEPSSAPADDFVVSALHFQVDYGFPFTDSV